MSNVYWDPLGSLIPFQEILRGKKVTVVPAKTFECRFCLEQLGGYILCRSSKNYASSSVHFVAVSAASSQHYPSASRNYVHGIDQIG